MLNFDEMIKCGQKYDHAKNQMNAEKYKAFIEYLKKVILITFKDNEEQIASYLKEKETTDQSFLLSWRVGGDIHSDGFCINRLTDKTIGVKSLRAHDSYYDPILNLESDVNDEELLAFFDREYKQFLELFIPNYYLEDCEKPVNEKYSLVCKIANKFNEVCFNKFKNNFKALNINDIYEFKSSKFSLSFTDEQRIELDGKVYEYYNSYYETINELTKKFDESVKDLK